MSIERTIIQRLNESHAIAEKLYESWPPVLNQIRSKSEKDKIRNTLVRAGIDIENTPYQEIVITNGKDPRLKGKNLVIFETHDGIGIWFDGKALLDTYIYSEGKNLLKLSWSKILSLSKRITSIEFDEKAAEELKQKKANRAEAKKGMEMRYTQKNKPRWAKIDKSGYVLNPNKYKDMLAKMNVDNGAKVLQDAKDVYVKISNSIDKIDWDMDERDYYNYSYIMQEIPRNFAYLTKALKGYEDAKKRDGDEEAKWYVKQSREDVQRYIKELKEIISKAKKYL